jgi:aryl-alcohol dehydrogenase
MEIHRVCKTRLDLANDILRCVGPVMTKALHSVSNSGTFVPLAVTQKNFEVNTFFDLVFGNKKVRGVLIGDTIAMNEGPSS